MSQASVGPTGDKSSIVSVPPLVSSKDKGQTYSRQQEKLPLPCGASVLLRDQFGFACVALGNEWVWSVFGGGCVCVCDGRGGEEGHRKYVNEFQRSGSLRLSISGQLGAQWTGKIFSVPVSFHWV